jgi:FlaG/FlaF family flagellin (archaellin)
MKKILSIFSLVMVFVFGSCIEQNYPIWEGAEVEFQAAVVTAPVAGQTYPRISITNSIGTYGLQVNLVARQRDSDETITYRVVSEGTTAVEGTDYNVSGSLVIPANSSIATLEVDVINTGEIGGSVDLLLELEGNSEIQASENYKRVQLRITRPSPPEEE